MKTRCVSNRAALDLGQGLVGLLPPNLRHPEAWNVNGPGVSHDLFQALSSGFLVSVSRNCDVFFARFPWCLDETLNGRTKALLSGSKALTAFICVCETACLAEYGARCVADPFSA